MTWGIVAKDKLEILSGEVRTIRHAGRIRSFAPCCGTPLFFQDDATATQMDVTIASLDDPAPFAPEITIWTEDRLPWVQLDATRPALRQNRHEQASHSPAATPVQRPPASPSPSSGAPQL